MAAPPAHPFSHPLFTPPACRNKLVQITYALANVYDDSPDLDVRVTEEHRARAEEMMGCVESGDVTRLRDMFMDVSVFVGRVGQWLGGAAGIVCGCSSRYHAAGWCEPMFVEAVVISVLGWTATARDVEVRCDQ
jgi:hypothetical protein